MSLELWDLVLKRKGRKEGKKEGREWGDKGLCSSLVREPVLTVMISVVEAVVPSK